jgi:hypothetical protein
MIPSLTLKRFQKPLWLVLQCALESVLRAHVRTGQPLRVIPILQYEHGGVEPEDCLPISPSLLAAFQQETSVIIGGPSVPFSRYLYRHHVCTSLGPQSQFRNPFSILVLFLAQQLPSAV